MLSAAQLPPGIVVSRIALFIASLAMWLITLAFELGGIPIAVDRLTEHSDTAQRALSESLFAGALISGYFADDTSLAGRCCGSPE